MTVDDNSSIYVGGLPYTATEETLHRVFDIYGAVVAVKIINDRTVGGKCYGFVTFKNPRSAMDAIDEMDGRTIDGRVVRVNEVKTRSGRPNYGRESFRHNPGRGATGDRSRVRERDAGYERDRYRDAHRERSRDRNLDRVRGYDRPRDHDKIRDPNVVRAGDEDHHYSDTEYVEPEPERNNDHDWERDNNQDVATSSDHTRPKKRDKDIDEMHNSVDGFNRLIHSERGFSPKSSDSREQAEMQLEISNQKLEDLQKEISLMEKMAEEKKHLVSKLQEKSKKLEDSLAAARNQSSHRQTQLSKLHKCYAQVKDYNERLKNSEQELQSLVDSTLLEVEYDGTS